MNKPIFSKILGELKLEIFQDQCENENPLTHESCERDNLFCVKGFINDENLTEEEFDNFLTKNNNKFSPFYVCPIYKYEHSNIVFSTNPFNCLFDSGLTGFSYVSKKVFKEYSKNYKNLSFDELNDKFREFVKVQLREFEAWANGEMFFAEISKKNYEKFEWERIECCGGFFEKESMAEWARDYGVNVTADEIEL